MTNPPERRLAYPELPSELDGPPGARSNGWSIVPLVAVTLSFFAVVATLVVMGRATRHLRDEIIGVTEPARTYVYDLQRLLALEEIERRRGFRPESTIPASTPAELRNAQTAALEALRPLLIRVRPDAVEALAEIRMLIDQWHATIDQQSARGPVSGAPEPPPETGSTYLQALTTANRLHRIVASATEARRSRIARLERIETALIAGLVLLGLASVFAIARIGRRTRELAEISRRAALESTARRLEVERVVEEKGQFIRGITHDLKNPLGAIGAYADLLDAEINGPLTAEQRKYVQRIRRAAQEMLSTINDLLELARAEVAQLTIDRSSVDLAPLVAEVVEDYRAAAESVALRLTVESRAPLPSLQTDARRVREILGNLLSNAIKYTSAGDEVCIRVEICPQSPAGAGPWMALRVEDTGPGIPPDHLSRIFDEFHRVGDSDKGGTGLGLAISRRIARLLGGDLTVESTVGQGSTFTLWLPAPAPRESHSTAEEIA